MLKRAFALIGATVYSVGVMALGVVTLLSSTAHATSLTSRKLQLESSQPGSGGQDIWHEFTFTVPTSTALTSLGSLEFTYCTTPLGSCTAPSGLDLRTTGGNYSLGTTTTDQAKNAGAWTNTYAKDTAGETANRIRINTGTANTITAGDVVKFRFDGIENPTTSSFSPSGNNSFFVRISAWSTTSYGGGTDDGVVASAIVPLLTVSARVQEILHFCVANTTLDEATPASPGADCAAIAGTTGSSIDLGVADNSTSGAVSPDSDGNSRNGLFMVRTNAVGGTIVGYRAVQQTGTNYKGALRVVGSTCTTEGTGKNDTNDGSNRVSTDQCFNAATTKTALGTSVEQFGMTGRYINRISSGTPTANLSLTTDYDSTSTVGYAWQQDGSFVDVATSVGSTDKVIDDEAVVLKFAAVASLTTPTGVYTAQADFVAIPTY